MLALKCFCPACGNLQGLPLIWGEPLDEVIEASHRGELICGGSALCPDENGVIPNWKCGDCGKQWYMTES